MTLQYQYVATAGLVLFPGNEFLSFLNAKVLLMMHHSLDIFPKYLRLDFLNLHVFFVRISRTEVVEERRVQRVLELS